MVSIAYERLMGMSGSKLKVSLFSSAHLSIKFVQVSFEIGDVMHHEFKANSFDVVYSRDTILHIADKKTLFTRLYVSEREREIICLLYVKHFSDRIELVETRWTIIHQ